MPSTHPKIKSRKFGRWVAHERRTLLIAFSVSIIGIYILTTSHAQSPYASIEAENGSLAGGATVQPNSDSSNGSFVQFGTPPGVNAAPTGPAAPASGWHVDLADDFNAPLGTGSGQDNLWYPSQGWNSNLSANVSGDNGYETEVYNSSQVSVSNGNLVLSARYQNDVGPANPATNTVQRNYVSGIVTTPTDQTGYKGFTWTPGGGSTWAFEITAQWPVNTGELFNAWWTSTASGWNSERDFFEGKTTSNSIDSDWIYQTGNSSTKKQDYYNTTLGFDPATAMHRYTYVIYPDQTWSVYVDGILQTWVGNNGIAPVETSPNAPMVLILDYALRTTGFTSGSRDFTIGSVAVYQDAANAGQFITGGGIAPGTTVK